MKVSLNWLKKHIDLDISVEELSHTLTMTGLEVEGVEHFESIKGSLAGLVIGEVVSCEKHPNADRLKVTKVDVGAEDLLSIVCGAPNVDKGQKVVVATIGATLYPSEGDSFKIKKGKIRGELSEGMICAEDEIGLGASHDGIMVLDTDLPNGTPAKDFFSIEEDTVFEIGLTPNRVDAASHYGVARDLHAVLDVPLNKLDSAAFKPDNNSKVFDVCIENKAACERYSGVSITGIDVAPSPTWLQNKLKAIGLAPINNVVDITNYVMHDLGQPLHAFDADKIADNSIVIKNLSSGTTFKTLDDVERELHEEDLMICDSKGNGLCIAGVFGGLGSGVSEQTKSVFLESAYFSADSVRATSQRHGLKTDAAFRFERGADPNMTIVALKKAALLIKEIAGGEISSDIIDSYPSKIEPFRVEVSLDRVNRLIGKDIPSDTVKGILNRLEIEVTEEKGDNLVLSVPPYRVDVQREADVVEEVLRIYGYNSIEIDDNLGSNFLSYSQKNISEKVEDRLSQILCARGFYEILSNPLTSSKYLEVTPEYDANENVDILNMLSEDLDVMRQSLIFSGLESVARNINHQQRNIKLFEFGKEYKKVKPREYSEKEVLALWISGKNKDENWNEKVRNSDFYDLAAMGDILLKGIGIQNASKIEFGNNAWGSYGINYLVGSTVIGTVGVINKTILNLFKIKQPVFYAEFSLAEVKSQIVNKKFQFKEISKFPSVRRDLSLVIDKGISFQKIQDLSFKIENRLLTGVNVFDIYEDKSLGDNKKSYSVSFTLQDNQKTLTDKVIDKTMNRLIKGFEDEYGALIRK